MCTTACPGIRQRLWTHLCNSWMLLEAVSRVWSGLGTDRGAQLRKRRRRRRHSYFHLRSRRHNHHPVQRVRLRQRRQRRHRRHRHHRLQRVLLLLLRRRRPPLLQLLQRRSWLPTGQQFCLRCHFRRLQRVLLLLLLLHPPLALRAQPQRWPQPQRMPSPLQQYPSPHLQPHLQPPGCPPLSHCLHVLLSYGLARSGGSVGWALYVLLLDGVWAPPSDGGMFIRSLAAQTRQASLTRKPASPRPPRRPQAPSYVLQWTFDMHQPKRGQPAVVPAPPAAGTSDAAAADASTVATVPPPQTPSPRPPLRSPCTPPRRLPVVARPAARRTACAEQVPELPATPPPHRCLDEDPATWGRTGGRAAKPAHAPPRPPPPTYACCLCIRGAVCVCCVRACVRVLSQTPLTLSNPMLYPSTRACRPAAVQFCNTCLGIRPVAELKDINTSVIQGNQCRD